MKKGTIVAGLLPVVLLISASVYAQVEKDQTIPHSFYRSSDSRYVHFFFDENDGRPFYLSIEDKNGNSLTDLSETARQGRKKLDISNLEPGEYRAILRKGSSTDSFTFQREQQADLFSANLNTEKPEQSIKMSFAEAQSPVFLEIYDRMGNTVFTQTFEERQKSCEIDVSQLESGSYTILVSNGQKNIKKSFKI